MTTYFCYFYKIIKIKTFLAFAWIWFGIENNVYLYGKKLKSSVYFTNADYLSLVLKECSWWLGDVGTYL